MSLPDFTILIGPHTRLALAINATVRGERAALLRAGVSAFPNRGASPAARALAVGEAAPNERWARFQSTVGGTPPTFLAALNFLGAPSHAIAQRELFPDMGSLCLGLAAACETAPRLVLSVEPLDQFFVSVGSDALGKRVRATPWETLYEISWADLAGDIVAALPDAELLVMTPETALCRSGQLASVLFGEAGDAVNATAWQSAHLRPEGQAAVAQMEEAQTSESVLIELGERLGNGPTAAELFETFGIDGLTKTLLRQRFEEDLARIADLPGVRML